MKKSNKKKREKSLSIKTLLVILLIIAIIGVGVFYFLTAEDEDTSLTLLEKQWIEKNKDTLVSIKVPNNMSVLGEDGTGVLFDFINKIEEETELRFNKISYTFPSSEENVENGLSILVLKKIDTISENDRLILEDNYVLIGDKKGFINDLNNINSSKIGVLKDDISMFSNLSITNSFSFLGYSSIDSSIRALENGKVDYLILPRYASMEKIMKADNLHIKYNFSDYSNKVVLRLGSNKRLNSIAEKYLENWLEEDYRESLEESLMSYYVNNSDVSDAELSSLTSRVYVYGYVSNGAYNIGKGNNLYGIAGEYINTLSNMSDMEIKFVEFSNSNKLIKALEKKQVDFAFINFNYNKTNLLETNHVFNSNLVALSKKMHTIDSKNALVNKNISVLKDTYLSSYLKSNYNSLLNEIKNYNAKIDDNSILILDEVDYNYYKNTSLNSYNYIFSDNYPTDYYYVMASNNKIINDILNYILTYTNYDEFKITSYNNIDKSFRSADNFKTIYMLILVVILLPIILTILTILFTKAKKKTKMLKRDILKYTDLLTSLKNRNYLTDNIESWDETKVYPRTIIMIDLNNLKYVNDNYGQEEGNVLIKKAAAILINTQLEKSEIIRTDGNEFLIYLIGYNKTQINSYINKLTKEFEKLPYGFGAAIGFSQIDDEIKTVDDAINEATIEMRNDKEQNYK